MAPPVSSAFAGSAAVAAVAAASVASTAPVTSASAMPSAALVAAAFAPLRTAVRRDEDGLVGDAEEGRELALQRGPEADRLLHRDDDGLDLQPGLFFAARTFLTPGLPLSLMARLTPLTWFAMFTRLTRFTRLAAFAALSLGRGGPGGEGAGDGLLRLGGILDHSDGGACAGGSG